MEQYPKQEEAWVEPTTGHVQEETTAVRREPVVVDDARDRNVEDDSEKVSFHMIDNKHSFHHVETEADVAVADVEDSHGDHRDGYREV